MEEGDWIDMTRVPLITAEGATTEVALGATRGEDAENEGAGAEYAAEADHAAEAKRPIEVERTAPVVDDRTNDAERAAEAEHATRSLDACHTLKFPISGCE
jgi:hypothetical protein